MKKAIDIPAIEIKAKSEIEAREQFTKQFPKLQIEKIEKNHEDKYWVWPMPIFFDVNEGENDYDKAEDIVEQLDPTQQIGDDFSVIDADDLDVKIPPAIELLTLSGEDIASKLSERGIRVTTSRIEALMEECKSNSDNDALMGSFWTLIECAIDYSEERYPALIKPDGEVNESG